MTIAVFYIFSMSHFDFLKMQEQQWEVLYLETESTLCYYVMLTLNWPPYVYLGT